MSDLIRDCLGCGYCCKKATCSYGVAENKTVKSPCPSLVFKDGRYWCDEVLKAQNPRIGEILAIGAGCSSPMFNTDRWAMLKKRMKKEGESA